MLAARYFPSIKRNHNNIHQNFPFITFTENDSILTMSQQRFYDVIVKSGFLFHSQQVSVSNSKIEQIGSKSKVKQKN